MINTKYFHSETKIGGMSSGVWDGREKKKKTTGRSKI